MNWDAFVQILVLFAVGFLIFSKLISAFAVEQEREKSARTQLSFPEAQSLNMFLLFIFQNFVGISQPAVVPSLFLILLPLSLLCLCY